MAKITLSHARINLRRSETLELLADPKFKAHLERMKKGAVRYYAAVVISVHPRNPW
ncbi:MAG TPA: hypothetical protein VNU49_06840 [Opitutaceae bacterium]|jgi:hypothetical protein|nr:hypothetical protein [Opitutaceae bacterium]